MGSVDEVMCNMMNTYLCSQIWDADEFLEDIFGQDVGVTRLLDVIRWDVDVVGSEMEVCSRYGPDMGEKKQQQTNMIYNTVFSRP